MYYFNFLTFFGQSCHYHQIFQWYKELPQDWMVDWRMASCLATFAVLKIQKDRLFWYFSELTRAMFFCKSICLAIHNIYDTARPRVTHKIRVSQNILDPIQASCLQGLRTYSPCISRPCCTSVIKLTINFSNILKNLWWLRWGENTIKCLNNFLRFPDVRSCLTIKCVT